jgi:sugar lactone lactonase YvrE
MNCKWAEGHLSASLDGTLDPAVRDEVEAHVKGCTHCGGILDEFQRFDGLLRDLPRCEPSADLRQHIFGSPEFAAILHELDGATPGRSGSTLSPAPSRSSALRDDEQTRGHDRPLEPLPIPARAPVAVRSADSAHVEHADEVGARRTRTGAPPWARVALSAAAAVVLVAGTAMLVRHGLAGSTPQQGHTPGISDVGNPSQQPIAAGTRVVFQRGGALWSAPEHGPGLAKQLTSSSVTVAPGWTVVPASSSAGGDLVAYIDLKTGLLHVVRSDGQRDRTIGPSLAPSGAGAAFWSSPEGEAISNGLAWAPSGSALAYLADDGTGRIALFVAPMAGGSIARVTAQAGVSASMVRWSLDSARIAFVQSNGVSQSLWDYNVSLNQIRELSATAEPGGQADAVVRQIAWLGVSAGPVVTWASGGAATGTITGVFSMSLTETAPRMLVDPGSSFIAAGFSPAAPDGTWLLGDGAALYTVSGIFPGRQLLTSAPAGVTAVAWSSGRSAAYLDGDGTLYAGSAGQFAQVASGVSTAPGMQWSPDGSTLAFVASGQLSVVKVATSGGHASAPSAVAGLSGVTSFAWAPDGQSLAVSTGSNVALVAPSGAVQSVVDTHGSEGAVVWSVIR